MHALGSLTGDLVRPGGYDEWIDVEDHPGAIKVCVKIIVE